MPDDCLVGALGGGFKDAMRVLDGGRISIAALALGMARGALDAAVKYSKQRKQFGKAISEFQAIGFKMADMATQLDAAWLLTMRAAQMKDQGKTVTREAAMAKLFAERGSVQNLRRGRADSRRLRLHQGLSGGEVLSRCEAVHDRRGHERDSADGDCAGAAEELVNSEE